MATELDTIGRLRASVDELDRLLVELLNRRARLALAVAQEKARLGLAVRAPGREQEVIARVRQANAGPLDEDAVARVFRSIIDESRRIQESSVAPPQAAEKHAESSASLLNSLSLPRSAGRSVVGEPS